jgi:UDP-glucose 4-epimerase
VINELRNAGKYEIRGLVRNLKATETGQDSNLEKFLRVDISDYKTFEKARELNDTDIIIHTAGLAHQFGQVTNDEFRAVNVIGTENVCRLAHEIGAKHFIQVSSVSVYGDYGNTEVTESFDCKPSGIYAVSKLEAEKRAAEFCARYEIRLTVLRLATVIGEGDRGNTSRLIRAIKKGRFVWIGSGKNKKSLIYKGDVAKGILKIIQSREDTGLEILNLTAEAVSMKEVVKAISKALNKKTPRIKISEELIRAVFNLNKMGISIEYIRKFENTFEKWLSDDIFSGKRLYEKYNFKPQTPISEGLARQVEYFLNKNK